MSLKVLIVRFSSIGDIVLTTPIIRAAKLQLGAEVHYVTKKSMASVLAHNPYIDTLHTIDDKVDSILPTLQSARYDYIIDLHKNLRTYRLRKALSRSTRTFDKLNVQKWLLVHTKINRLPDLHIVDRYYQAVADLGIKDDGQGLDYFLNKNEEQYGQDMNARLGPYTVLVLGANYFTKRLPIDKISELIASNEDQHFVLVGGPDVQAVGEQLSTPAHVTNTCGHTSLGQSAAIIKYAQQVITGDTGMMHIAAAMQQNVVSVWGSTVPAFGMGPYFGSSGSGQGRIVEVEQLGCRPCSKLGYQKCPKGHFRCMRDIKIDQLL